MPDPLTILNAELDERVIIGRELGRGGMATVYLAEERKHGRPVAIKVLRPELAASVGAERFLREIGIVARAHPHIVPLIDSGDAAGVLYYVSASVAGGSLRDRLALEAQLPEADAIRIARGPTGKAARARVRVARRAGHGVHSGSASTTARWTGPSVRMRTGVDGWRTSGEAAARSAARRAALQGVGRAYGAVGHE